MVKVKKAIGLREGVQFRKGFTYIYRRDVALSPPDTIQSADHILRVVVRIDHASGPVDVHPLVARGLIQHGEVLDALFQILAVDVAAGIHLDRDLNGLVAVIVVLVRVGQAGRHGVVAVADRLLHLEQRHVVLQRGRVVTRVDVVGRDAAKLKIERLANYHLPHVPLINESIQTSLMQTCLSCIYVQSVT
jgi:hypothetical protein